MLASRIAEVSVECCVSCVCLLSYTRALQ